jgi:hypothetical protein
LSNSTAHFASWPIFSMSPAKQVWIDQEQLEI